MECSKCGSQLVENSVFCNRCGNRVKPPHIERLGFAGIYSRAMSIFYVLAILTCFICNLAVERTLSWFYIVLSAIALAYSVTNIPFAVKKHKAVASGLCASAALYALLFVCNWLVQGNWLFKIAFPLATVSLLFAWGILMISVSRRMNWLVKSALILLMAGAATITINPLCDYLLDGSGHLHYYWRTPAAMANKIVFICCLSYSVIALILNPVLNIRKKHTT